MAEKRARFRSIVVLAAVVVAVTADYLENPKFSHPITNVTVAVGREAILACLVEDLGGYKVAWLRVDTQTILTIHSHVITKNHRIGVTHSEHKTWYLHIKEVRESDRGWYMCQINTDPMKSQVGYLDVVGESEGKKKGKEMKITRRCVEDAMKENREDRILLRGDFNGRIGEKGARNWEEEKWVGKRKSKDKVENAQGKRLMEWIEENVWEVLNGNKQGDKEGDCIFVPYFVEKREATGEEGQDGKLPLICHRLKNTKWKLTLERQGHIVTHYSLRIIVRHGTTRFDVISVNSGEINAGDRAHPILKLVMSA
ncbi:hypothetical protein GEV33_011335 [Tenebrio molitor]|uniref:Ig-like domain-containing protein n=1 Tax=Tenebrio molitor TaxID=7067 RepID=A0A8J6HBV3_TENMO|nr:hypothetical protein GEV33_011335 [Tenebrio molitor]